jgi:hypothetical protein
MVTRTPSKTLSERQKLKHENLERSGPEKA